MLKYVSKFVLDILPSVVATIVGAYIVNHYIIPKPDAGKPAAAVASTPDPAGANKAASAKPSETSSDLANVPAPAVSKAKGGEKPVVEKAALDKSEKPDSASAPAESRRHQPAARDKAVAKATPAAVVVAPSVATVSVAPVESAPTAEERRDANDLARAAIERLRGAKDAQPAPQEAARAPEVPRAQEAVRSETPPAMPQLPPPIMVSTPSVETFGSVPSRPPYAPERTADPRRPRPPGEIPSPPPLDLQADATGSTRHDRSSVAEDVLSAAKSVFQSVIPKEFER
jgi:hypothetical protein